MADNEGGFGEDNLSGASFSQLLFSDEVVGLDIDESFAYSSLPPPHPSPPPKMLCFGGFEPTTTTTPPQKSGVTCSDSSSASSTNNTNIINKPSKSNKKRNGSGNNVSVPTTSTTSTAPAPAKVQVLASDQRNSKKTKSESSTSGGGHVKVKKEKLGERITALQQLVSPFGKTDTASVLHEAMGYIRFLQEQVQVLCSPYLQTLPSSAHLSEGGENGEDESRRRRSKDLRSRGLCLVPLECTEHVANNNGADYWSPAMATNTTSSSFKK